MKNKYLKNAKLSEPKFRALVRLFSADVPALTTSQLLSLNQRTSQRLYALLRLRLADLSRQEAGLLAGEVEVDESYFGAKRVRGKRGRGASGKIPVIGLLKRGGKVHVQIVQNCTREQLMPVIKGQVLSSSTVFTDGWKAYDSLVLEGYKHHRIHHHENEFARGRNHVNGIESFWSFTKLRLAKLRGIRKEKFVYHLLESAWRFNHRHENICRLILKKLPQKSPLSYLRPLKIKN